VLTINTLLFQIPFVLHRAAKVTGLGVTVTTVGGAGSVVRLALASWNGSTMNFVIDAGTIDGTVSGYQEIAINETLGAGAHVVGVVAQGGASPQVTLRAATGFYMPGTNLSVLRDTVTPAAGWMSGSNSSISGTISGIGSLGFGTSATAPVVFMRLENP
jgi:hypothetical protein